MKACRLSCEVFAICLTRKRFGARVVCITLRPAEPQPAEEDAALQACVDTLSERPFPAPGCKPNDYRSHQHARQTKIHTHVPLVPDWHNLQRPTPTLFP